jgi:hypothetical protein
MPNVIMLREIMCTVILVSVILLSIVMPSAILLNVIMSHVILLSVVMLSAIVPLLNVEKVIKYKRLRELQMTITPTICYSRCSLHLFENNKSSCSE